MAIQILDEINKANNFQLEVDLGFNIQEFGSSYSKRFFMTNNLFLNVNLILTKEELNLFDTWYNDTLNMGILDFEADFGFGFETQLYTFISQPEIAHIEADLFNVNCLFTQSKGIPDLGCVSLNSCQKSILQNLEGNNTSLAAIVEAPEEKKRLYLCLENLAYMVGEDSNLYIEKKSI